MDKNSPVTRFPFFSRTKLNELLTRIRQHNVYVDTEENFGTGVRIGPTEVLSVYHVKEADSWIRVNGHPAEIVHHDKKTDLLLLTTAPCRISSEVQIKPYPEVLDPVISIGNLKRNPGLFDVGSVMKVTKSRIYFSNRLVDGFSGGALYLYTGELVGMMLREQGEIETGTIPVAVPGAIIKKFLSEIKRDTEPQLHLDYTG